MNVAIVNLTSGGLSGGYVKYLRRLVPLLRGDTRIDRLEVFLPDGIALPECGEVRTWPAGRGLAGLRALRRGVAEVAPDVVFFPTARRIECDGRPTVVMVRNMEPLTVPFAGNTWREGLLNIARAREARVASRSATRVIAVSKHVRDFVTGRWGIPSDRVGLVYHGTDAPGRITPALPGAPSWPSRFLFTAGSIRPARGLEDAIRAMPLLRSRGEQASLVIAGRADASSRPYERRMRNLVERLGMHDAVIWAGHLNEQQMAWGYERCVAFVVTSRAEACPNVALEALSHGAAIVSTSQEPMPEFFRNAAGYYPPRDAGALASRVMDVLAVPPGAGDARRDAARTRAAEFTWARTAAETVAQLTLAAAAR